MEAEVPDSQVAPPARFETVDRSPQQALLAQDYASFWRRLVAVILDGILLRVIAAVISGLVAGLPLQEIPVIDVLYSIGFIAFGATPGMHALGIRVIDGAGNPPGVKRSIVRYIIPALSWLPLLIVVPSSNVFLDFGAPIGIVLGVALAVLAVLDPLWMIWDAQKQTLHDKLASTYVVKTR
jgi:uncharacterized RDD family membrane protein YckC